MDVRENGRPGRPPLVLASASRARYDVLTSAGLLVEAVASGVDEGAVKRRLAPAAAGGVAVAQALADAKAAVVADQRPAAVVIGADQVLECEGRLFDKPADRCAAAAGLRSLRGRSHRLVSAVAVAEAGEVRWRCVDRAVLTMRPFSDEFLERYLDRIGAAATASVGAYQLEGLGVQLFSRVEGDFFTVLGLPLLPLLGHLRDRGMIDT